MFNISISKELCKGCELCVELCPKNVLGITEVLNSKGNTFATVEKPEECVGCKICSLVCPDACIEITKCDD
jgi:2-oxoglutarate ferredoxin oxidoreductase subunit delta